MEKAFICTPYNAKTHYEIKQNILAAEVLMKNAFNRGYAVYCPHTMTAFWGGAFPEQVFYNSCIEFLKLSQVVFLNYNWRESKGCRKEVQMAKMLKLKFYLKERTEEYKAVFPDTYKDHLKVKV